MNLQTAFCMDVGQVKSGIDTYVKMLQEIVRVTGPVAYGIAAEYPNVHSLVKGFERSGPTTLQDLKVNFLISFPRVVCMYKYIESNKVS